MIFLYIYLAAFALIEFVIIYRNYKKIFRGGNFETAKDLAAITIYAALWPVLGIVLYIKYAEDSAKLNGRW